MSNREPMSVIVVLGGTNSTRIERGNSPLGVGIEAGEQINFRPTHLKKTALRKSAGGSGEADLDRPLLARCHLAGGIAAPAMWLSQGPMRTHVDGDARQSVGGPAGDLPP
jgi:hypothetical protein